MFTKENLWKNNWFKIRHIIIITQISYIIYDHSSCFEMTVSYIQDQNTAITMPAYVQAPDGVSPSETLLTTKLDIRFCLFSLLLFMIFATFLLIRWYYSNDRETTDCVFVKIWCELWHVNVRLWCNRWHYHQIIVFDIICYAHQDSAVKFDLSFNFRSIQYGFETESKTETLMQ